MSEVVDHYEGLLARHYTWMLGPELDRLVADQRALLTSHGIPPGQPHALALDLGCGSGIQSIALAQMGYGTVLSLDNSKTLLAELTEYAAELPAVQPILADLCDGLDTIAPPRTVNVAVCMGDTLPHLPDTASVRRLFDETFAVLAPGGLFVLSFRDLTARLTGLDRFLPIRADHDRIMTCFLEDEGDTVRVHDLVHTLDDDGTWQLGKSSYRKLRLAPEWVARELTEAGFVEVSVQPGPRGMSVVIARRPALP